MRWNLTRAEWGFCIISTKLERGWGSMGAPVFIMIPFHMEILIPTWPGLFIQWGHGNERHGSLPHGDLHPCMLGGVGST